MQINKMMLPSNNSSQLIRLPFRNAREARKAVCHVEGQNNVPMMWYENNNRKRTKDFIILGVCTGHNWEDLINKEQYIGTVVFNSGNEFGELHYFLIGREELEKDYFGLFNVME